MSKDKTPRILKRSELIKLLNMADYKLSSWVRNHDDFPATVRRGHYNTEDVCRWILKRKALLRGPQAPQLVEKATEVIEEYEKNRKHSRDAYNNKKNANSQQDSDTTPKDFPVLKFRGFDEGLNSSLLRHEDVEKHYAELFKYHTDRCDFHLANRALDMWTKAGEALRKCKAETIKIQQTQGKLIPLELAEDFVTKSVKPMQMALLKIPRTLAPELENLPKEEIEMILDKVIREVLQEGAK